MTRTWAWPGLAVLNECVVDTLGPKARPSALPGMNHRGIARSKTRRRSCQVGQKPYEELIAIKYPQIYEVGRKGEADWFQVEVTLLEVSERLVHVAVAVSDSGWSSFFPKSVGVIAPAWKSLSA